MSALIVALAGLLFTTSAWGEAPASKIPELIENRTYGFRVSNPDRWQAMKNKTDNLVLLGHPEKPKINFVTVTVEDLSKAAGVTLEGYQTQLIENLKKSVRGFQMRGDELANIDGAPAREIIYAGSLDTEPMRWKTSFTLKKNRAYVLTYAADEHEYFKYLEAADKILYSFRFI